MKQREEEDEENLSSLSYNNNHPVLLREINDSYAVFTFIHTQQMLRSMKNMSSTHFKCRSTLLNEKLCT